MKTPAEFDVLTCRLDGVNLIEASAGTGKTWNICGLYLRLLLERGLEVQKILVVTFTNAATAELRERIRSGIAETLALVREQNAPLSDGDRFVQRLVQQIRARQEISPARLIALLDQALQFFDEAAIYTIHGFCQRAHADASFTAGVPFALELVTDDSEMVMEAVRDFWRRRVADPSCPVALATHLLARGDTPEKYAKFLMRSLAKPLARVRWPSGIDESVPADLAALSSAYQAAGRTWGERRAEIVDRIIGSQAALNASVYKPQAIEKAIGAWEDWFTQDLPYGGSTDTKPLELLSSDTLARRTKKKQLTPAHPFFDQARDLLAARQAVAAALELARMRLLRELVETAGPELRSRKRERHVISFDDMLHNLYEALADGRHAGLAGSLREKFPVALIDEFQDTDPLQFGIFERIYGGSGGPAFFVGDPKQAIYSFRNADLHAYLLARRHASAEYTLSGNQRATPRMIEALNGLFSFTRQAFMLAGLDYHPVRSGDKRREPFVDGSGEGGDLRVWTLPAQSNGAAIERGAAIGLAGSATAAQIAGLITQGARADLRIGARPLQPSDIAVLVHTHAQGSQMKRELAGLNIGSVELSQSSVFRSAQAEEIERVLLAINEPSRDALLRGALATEMMGFDADGIAQVSGDEEALLLHLERFAAYRDLWLRQGVGIMFRRLLADHRVSARMLRLPDGERRLTNLLHLGELIHQAAATHESPDALLRWLQTQRREGSPEEVAQLRLESDRNWVRIVTIHKAKGLEFPVVFCPFLWDGRAGSGGAGPEGREYHDSDGGAVIDLRSDAQIGDPEREDIEARIRLEQCSEQVRLIYVAMTRAVYRCYLVAGTYSTRPFGNVSTSESTRSLLNWLACGGQQSPASWLDGTTTQADIAAAWDSLASRLHPWLTVAPVPTEPGAPVKPEASAPERLTALAPPASIAAAWRSGSFTSLTSDARGEVSASDHDARIARIAEALSAPPAQLAADDILRFPRGTRAGDCLHAVFERIDFADPSTWGGAIAHALRAHPQVLTQARAGEPSPLLARSIARLLADVTQTRLADGIVLKDLPLGRRLTELEFNLPVPQVSAGALNGLLKSLGYPVPRLAFQDLQGYLKGFIDLVFEHERRYYLLDWKSNHLGFAPADYGRIGMQAAMAEHAYHLQYLLYTLAVDRYLKWRVPGYRYERHFGGVLYLFVRGVRPVWADPDGAPAGVFFHRPDAAAVARLDALFAQVPERTTA